LVAPSSPFKRDAFDAGCRELERLGLCPTFEDSVFTKGPIVAGAPAERAAAFDRAWLGDHCDALMAVRGGYGSMEILPFLDVDPVRRRAIPFVGYSDTTAVHIWLNGHVGMTSIHGPMIDGRLSVGESAYDSASFVASLGDRPMGELLPDGVEVVRNGDATGPLIGGTLTTLAASLGTPFDFRPPGGAVMFIEEVGERPYRIRRLLEQLRQAGRFAGVAGLLFGQFPGCDEPDGRVTARAVIADFVEQAGVPALFGFPSGHTTSPLVTLPFGVSVRLVGGARPGIVLQEAAGC
jgi:muramoyltetrapeptide carboxypeptidase